MKLEEREDLTNTRRYSFKDIIVRHIQYFRHLLLQTDIYDYEQQALIEYDKCRNQRNMRKSAETEYFKKKLKRVQRDKYIISRVAVSVTNQCSLKCRDCNNLMPYCKEKFTIDVKEQIRDLEKLLYYADGIINVEVIGGEPFVYRQLPELLQYLCDMPKIKFIEITSNGTILPSKEILELLKNPKVCVLLSDYGKVNSEKANRTYRYLKQNQICVQNLKNREWIQGGNVEKRKKGRMRLKYEYFHCDARKDCRTLYKGRLYVCGRAPILDELELLTDESSFVDIRKMNADKMIGRKRLYDFFKNDYAESCAYCDCSSDFTCWIESGIQK